MTTRPCHAADTQLNRISAWRPLLCFQASGWTLLSSERQHHLTQIIKRAIKPLGSVAFIKAAGIISFRYRSSLYNNSNNIGAPKSSEAFNAYKMLEHSVDSSTTTAYVAVVSCCPFDILKCFLLLMFLYCFLFLRAQIVYKNTYKNRQRCGLVSLLSWRKKNRL